MSNQQQGYTNYNNYAQYYNAPAPPQPAWSPQATPSQPPPRPGWTDPRASQHYAQQPHQAAGSGASSYSPNPYGPMSGASPAPAQALQHTWGVKYQQQAQQQQYQQQHEPKPPLPTRPLSAASRIDAPVAPYHLQSPTHLRDRPNDGQYAQLPTASQPWAAHSVHYQPQAVQPPLPPPRPAAYAQNATNWLQEHYASKPPSHHYEHSTNPNWNQASAEQQHFTSTIPEAGYSFNNASEPQNQVLVSPVDPMSSSWTQSSNAAPQASLSHTTTHDHYHLVQSSMQGDPDFAGHIPLQGATAAPTSDWEHFAPESYAVSPEVTYSTPADPQAQNSMAEAVPVHGADQSHSAKVPDVQHEQHNPSTENRANPQQESFSSDVPEQTLQRTGTIDSVIHAWNAPLQPRKGSAHKPAASMSPSMQSTFPSITHVQNQAQLRDLRTQTPTPQSLAAPASDLYDDFEPQFRASLTRFVSMLRKESAAESDEEKFKVFDSFIQKERRLRAVLYDIDLTPATTDFDTRDVARHAGDVPPVGETKAPAQQPQSEGVHVSAKTLPVLATSEKQELPKSTTTPPKTSSLENDGSPESKKSPTKKDEELIDDMAAYSPGGRPVIPRPITVNTHIHKAPIPTVKSEAAILQSHLVPSPSDNAPQVVGEDYASTVPESPALAAPIVLAPKETGPSPNPGMAVSSIGLLPMPIKFEPPRPVYTPFRYAEGPQGQSEHLDAPIAPDQDYLSKRNTYDSTRLMAHEIPPPSHVETVTSPSTTKKVQEETFLGLIRSHSTMRPKQKTISVPESIRPRTTPPSSQMRSEPIADATQALRATLPSVQPVKLQTDEVLQIRRRVEAFVDDFGFIRETVIPWDRENRELRKKLDEARHKRKEVSETRLDELFNDNEIAYAELKGMEADSRLAEAERRYEEDKQELESFTKAVYNPVTSRLQKQIDALNKEYILAVDMLDLQSDSAGRMLTSNGTRSATSAVMDIVLQLFARLNIRYQKQAEGRFERERRRKRLELTVLYTNGDSEGTKKLEKEFSTGEKLQVLHEAHEKSQRASKLMNSIERATVRALGDNQAFLDELFAKVRRLNDVFPADGSWQRTAADSVYGENGALKVLASAQAVIDFVLVDSRALLTVSNAADKILNDADYAVSIAEARVANADESTYSKLKTDFAKEEGKLVEEMSMHMDSITKTPAECAHLIRAILARTGDDKEHADRMKKALEQAKMRNVVTET